MADRSERDFFYGLLSATPERRQFFLWQWLLGWPKGSTWAEFVETLLYQKVEFVVESERLLILGPRLPIRFEWLTSKERDFVVNHVFAKRHILFDHVRILPNQMIQLHGHKVIQKSNAFVPYFDNVWRRQLLRDLAIWLAFDEDVQETLLQFMKSIHQIAIARGDVWLVQIYAALNGLGPVEYVPCWGNGPLDTMLPWKMLQQQQMN